MKGGGLAVAALLLLGGCLPVDADGDSAAQSPDQASRDVPPPPEAMARAAPEYPAGAYLGQRYGLTPEEAARRHANEELTSEFIRTALADRDTRISAIWIRHEPSYAVVVNVKPPYDRDALIAQAPEALRGDLEFVEVSRTRPEISRDEDRLIAAFRPLDFAWSGGYRVQTDRFRYTAGSPAAAERLRAAVPEDLRADVEIGVESQPVPL